MEAATTYKFTVMQNAPKLKLSDNWGIPAKIEHKYTTTDPISYDVCPTTHPKDLRTNFSRKYFISPASEPAELVALRKRSGMNTPGKMDHIFPPPKTGFDSERIINQPKKSGKCSDWGGGLDQSNNYC